MVYANVAHEVKHVDKDPPSGAMITATIHFFSYFSTKVLKHDAIVFTFRSMFAVEIL